MRSRRLGLLFACMIAFSLHGESGSDAWLRYQSLPARVSEADVQALGDSVTLPGSSEVLLAARDEFSRGFRGMLGRIPRHDSTVPATGGVVIGRLRDVAEALPSGGFEANVPGDVFLIKTVQRGSARYTVVAGSTDRGVLYGVFAPTP